MAALSVAVVCAGALVVPTVPGASADQIGSDQAQLQALRAQVTTAASRVRALTVAYEQANTRAGTLQQEVAADQAQLTTLERSADDTRAALRQEALLGYTGSLDSSASPEAGQGQLVGADDPAVKAEYMQVASGNVADTLDRYRAEETQVAAGQAALAQEVRTSEASASAADAARQQALAGASSAQTQLERVQGQLDQLLAAQAAAQAAAARATAASQQGLPVNGGLVAVVRTVVSSAPAPAPTSGGAGGEWLQLRECESGDNYQADTGNGFYGAYQFSPQTWTDMGYPGRPDQEPPAMQDEAAQRLQAQSGWGQWPACSAALGLH